MAAIELEDEGLQRRWLGLQQADRHLKATPTASITPHPQVPEARQQLQACLHSIVKSSVNDHREAPDVTAKSNICHHSRLQLATQSLD
jgi:hypothetical protein